MPLTLHVSKLFIIKQDAAATHPREMLNLFNRIAAADDNNNKKLGRLEKPLPHAHLLTREYFLLVCSYNLARFYFSHV